MQQVAIQVDTMRCEADDAEVLAGLLAHAGVLDAEIDLANERVALAFDERLVTRREIVERLAFFGLAPARAN